MSNRRLVQHRVQRDTNNRENAELKKENEKLKRQVARLRKQIVDDGDEETPEESEPETKAPTLVCPECASDDLASIATPTGAVRYACRGCKKWRGTKPSSL